MNAEITKAVEAVETSEPSIEEQAKDMGWRPKEEYEGEEGKWVGAREFVERKPIYDRIHKLEQTNKKLSQTVHEFTGHVQKAERAAYQRAVTDLEAKKAYAVESAATQTVQEVDRQLNDLRSRPPQTSEAIHPAIESFIEENQEWWKDEEMQDYAVSRHNRVLASGNSDMESSLKKVLKDVQNRFPDHPSFHNGNRDRPSSVEGGRRSARGRSKRYTVSDLTPIQKDIGQRWVRSGALKSMQEYVNELAKVGDIE